MLVLNFRVKNRRTTGFTLIEVLVVIAIIALLSSLAMIAVRAARERAKVAKAQSDIDTFYTAIGNLMVDTDEWPGHQTPELVNSGSTNEVWDLNAAVAGLTQSDGSYNGWHGPYIVHVGKDPWGNDYFFDTDYSVNNNYDPCDGGGGCFDVVAVGSFGPNGEGQNVYDDDDIIKVIK